MQNLRYNHWRYVIHTDLEDLILQIRGSKVMLHIDLAELSGTTPKRLNQQVKRNKGRFPEDFMFSLSIQEVADLRSQFATSKARGGRRYLPYAFTEHGAVMAANVLSSQVAINASILLVRAFIKMRSMLSEHAEFKRKLQEIERKLAQGFFQYEQELLEIRFLIAKLETPLNPLKRHIGF